MAQSVRKQQGLKDRYYEGLVRAYPYMDRIKQIFEKERLPTALAFLPHVESSFNYRAYSKVGAAGMWQFMRSAAHTYGMKMNYLIDERRDPIISSRAAARFLRDNFAKLQAWPLAITAYNHGPKSVENAVRVLGTRELSRIIDKYENRRFGFASKNFYATFVATAEISSEPEKYFPNYPKQSLPDLAEINLKQRMTMDQIAKATGVSKDRLQDFNLALRPAIFKSNFYLPRNFSVRIPIAGEVKIAELENKVTVAAKETAPPPVNANQEEKEHVVRSGDNLYTIAKMYDVEVTDLIYRNGISQPSQLRPGMHLKIPEPGKRIAPVVAQVDTKRADLPPPKAESKPETKPVVSQPLEPSKPAVVAMNGKGQSLIAASQESVSGQDLFEMDMRSKSPDILASDETAYKEAEIKEPEITGNGKGDPGFFGKIKSLFAAEKTSAAEAVKAGAPLASSEPVKEKAPDFDPSAYNFDMVKVDARSQKIIVEIDETLGHYAEWSHTNPTVLRRMNRLGSRTPIRQGQKFLIPVSEESSMQFHLQRIRFHQAIEEDLYGNYKVSGDVEYRIRRGDTIGAICNKLDIPFWLLRKYFPKISDTRLAVGQVIRVPQLVPLRENEEPPAEQDPDAT